MSVLVTGGAGYIGSHVVYALLDRGEEVAVVDDLSTGTREILPSNIKFFVGDIADERLISNILQSCKVTAILHFAGSIVVSESVERPLSYYKNNTAKTRSLLDVAVSLRIPHFIFSSTAAVYGNPKNVPVSETENLAPISPYGRSKLMTEMMLADISTAHAINYVALRYFNVAGADPEKRTGQPVRSGTHLIKVAIEAALGMRARLQIYGSDYQTADGTCIRDFIHVSDLAQAHLDALAYLRKGGRSAILNCGYGIGYSVLQVVEAVKRVSGKDFPVDVAERRAGDPVALVADSTRARKLLTWKPQFQDLDLIVAHALAWEKYAVEHFSS